MKGKKILIYLAYFLLFSFLTGISAFVTLMLAVKGNLVETPKITGMKVDEAQKLLKSFNLKLQIMAFKYMEGLPEDMIISQDPQPTYKIKEGGIIKVVVNRGPEKVKLPDFKGKDINAVRLELADLGLEIGTLSQTYLPGGEPNQVLAQNPPPGEEVPKGSTVDFLVNIGYDEPAFIMPDFIGKKFEEVVPVLKQMGFQIAEPEYTYYPGWEAGIIINQLPFPGYKITRKQIVSFKVTSE